jgi:hypothetical protein
MMRPELERKIEEIISVQYLGTGYKEIKDADGNVVDKLKILTIWCAEIWFHAFARLPLIVGVIESTKWRRGIILRQTKASTIYDPNDGTTKPTVPEYKGDRIELPQDWEDPVAKALHSVDLMFRDTPYVGTGVYHYHLSIYTGITSTDFDCRTNENPQLSALYDALWETGKHFATLYNDDDLRQFMIRPWEDGYKEMPIDE